MRKQAAIKAIKRKLFLIILFFIGLVSNPIVQRPSLSAQVQVPIADYLGRWLSKTTSVVAQASEVITNIAEPLVNAFGEVQEFFVKAETVVSGVIKNMKAIQDIIDLEEEIRTYYQNSIDIINAPRDYDNDGVDDLSWLDKWKHLQILLALSKEALGGVELFINLIEDDALTMDDRNRIKFIYETKKDLQSIKTAMRIQMRRINQEVNQFGRLQKELDTFERLWSDN